MDPETQVAAVDQGLRISKVVRSADNSSNNKQYHEIVIAEINKMDKDGNGAIESDELYNGITAACDRAVKAEKKASNYKSIAIGLTIFVLLLAGANFATSFLAYNLGKDTKLDNGALMNMQGEAVGINQNMISIPLAATPWMDDEVIEKIERVAFSVEDDSGDKKKMFFRVASVEVIEKKSLKITTITNDKITWSANDNSILLTTNDGVSHANENLLCAKCSSVSIVPTDEFMEKLDEFYSFAYENLNGGFNGRKLWWGRPDTTCTY